ncbi:MAG: ATP-binding protein [Saprospiraceae bacterium]
MRLKKLYQKIINIGTTNLEEGSNLYIRVKAMNKIMLLGFFILLTLVSIGLYIQYWGFVAVGTSLVLLILSCFWLIHKKQYQLTWHLIFALPAPFFVGFSFFSMTSPSLVVFFICFQSLMLVFFKEKIVLQIYFIYYSICSVLFLYLLFEVNTHHINNNVWINIYTLITGLLVAYYALQFYISGKIKNEQTLRLQEQKFKTLFEGSPLGVMVSETNDTSKKTINRALANMLGYTVPELENKKISSITHPEDQDLHQDLFKQLLNGEIDFFELEKRYLHKDGTVVWGKIVITNIRDEDNKPLYTVATFLNMTKQKEQQEKIAALVQQLQKVNIELEQKVEERTKALTIVNDDLKRSNQDLEQFAYAASHDLKEPLRMISSFAQILERKYSDKIDDRGKEYLKFTIEGVQRMSDLIHSLLQYSRVGRKESKIRDTKISNIIEVKLIDLKQLINDKNATIDIQNLPTTLKCEPVQLGLVFYNLINNGLKFNENPNPIITINAIEEANRVIFSVADNGIGIEERFKDKIFEIFKRLHTRDKYDGTGIGLALCRKIIYRHNGDIWLESEIGKGTTFYFSVSKHL